MLAVARRPRFGGPHRAIDLGLLACLAVAAAGLVPLPPALGRALSPAAIHVDRVLSLAAPAAAESASWRPLSIDPLSTIWAVSLAGAAVLVFFCARTTFERAGGVRLVARGVAWIGLILSIVTFLQRSLSPHLFYGIWRPVARTDTPNPLGPFLNRNDLATWLILAIPLTAGYAAARVQSRGTFDRGRVEELIDERMVVIAGSLCLMMGLLLASASRSGIVGGGVGLLMLLVVGRRRLTTPQFVGMVGALAAVAVVATAYVSLPALTARFGDALAPDLGRGRLAIWRQIWPMTRAFWRVGVGVGAFERGMIAYQPRPFELFINQAHDEYLQVLTEGGVALALPVAVTIAIGCREAATRLRADHAPVGWMRAGAMGGMAAVAVQSVWDTGLRMPANAILFAVLAALALHERRSDS